MKQKQVRAWCELIEALRPETEFFVKELQRYGAVVARNRCPGSYLAVFYAPDNCSAARIWFQFMDRQCNSDIVITNMVTYPEIGRNKGYGSHALRCFLEWARRHRFNEVRATQVHPQNTGAQRFWQRHGFIYCPPPNPHSDFVFVIT